MELLGIDISVRKAYIFQVLNKASTAATTFVASLHLGSINDGDAKSSASSIILDPVLQKCCLSRVRQGFGENQSCCSQTVLLMVHVILVNSASHGNVYNQQDSEKQEQIGSHDLEK